MPRWVTIFLSLLPFGVLASESNNLRLYFDNLNKLDFQQARLFTNLEENPMLRFEMQQLKDILFFEGQIDKAYFKINEGMNSHKANERILSFVRELKSGYVSLFYDHLKENAYRSFYAAYQLAKQSGNNSLLKTSLLALLKYYNLEIAQNSNDYLPYLRHFESLAIDKYDRVWVTIYRMIFYSKSTYSVPSGEIDSNYFELYESLENHEKSIEPSSSLLTYVFYEKALQLDLGMKRDYAKNYYLKTVAQSKNYPFLRYQRFFAFLKLMVIAGDKKNFSEAETYLNKARKEIDKADTLRSNYHINLYHSHFLNVQNKNDSAFSSLWRAYLQEFKLDFRRNTLEVNRLNVELETQEKENANLRLTKARTWLIFALVGVGLLLLLSYMAYSNQRSKNIVARKEKEVQAMKLEKVLKDQEIVGIDAMLEGQEKERQRTANDLHDNLGSLLATLKLHFHHLRIRKDLPEEEHDSLLQKTDDLIDEAYQRVRGMAHAKNAGVNAQEGLLPAVKNFASKVSLLNKLKIEVEEHGMQKRLDNSLEITIFRIVQELITNVIKHAQATEVTIHLTQYDDKINMMVEDNGVGFDSSTIKASDTMGLYSIQKRIENLGGQVTIDSIMQKGTTVIIDVPLA